MRWPQAYGGGWSTGRDVENLELFRDPWPRFRIHTRLGLFVEVELFAVHERSAVVVLFRLERPLEGARLELRPLLAGRDFHHAHRENPGFDFRAEPFGEALRFAPYHVLAADELLARPGCTRCSRPRTATRCLVLGSRRRAAHAARVPLPSLVAR